MRTNRQLVLISALTAWTLSCATPEPAYQPEVIPLPSDPASYAPIASYEAMPIPDDNPMSAEKAALGRQLYYDQRLSGDGQLSCYSCHVCESGLTDGRATAVGAFGRQLTRSSPTLWNIGYHTQFYWDGRAQSLEAQALAAWKGGNMGADPDKIAADLNAIPGYKSQFQGVYQSDASPDLVARSLAAYMRTIISQDTPWDRWQAGDEGAVDDAVKRGYQVFQEAKCDNCHAGVLFTDQQFHNVGIGMDAETPDPGRFTVSNEEKDTGAFKTPTLRDIRQSAPYFHNGSVPTLGEAVDVMLAGGLDNPYLDKVNLQPTQLSADQRADLIEFLDSLDEPCEPQLPRLPSNSP